MSRIGDLLDELIAILHGGRAPTPVPGTGLVAALNAERAARGLAPLAEGLALDAAAQDWARTMAAGGVLTHGDFGSRIAHVVPNVAAGEDIAEGQPTVAAVVAAWMLSPPHRANILDPRFRFAGVGIVPSPAGTYWVVDLTAGV